MPREQIFSSDLSMVSSRGKYMPSTWSQARSSILFEYMWSARRALCTFKQRWEIYFVASFPPLCHTSQKLAEIINPVFSLF